MMIPFPVFDYAGPTVLARTAAWTAFTVVSVLAVFLLAMSVRSVRRGVRLLRFSWLHLTVIVAVCYLLAWFLAGPELDHAWWYLRDNVKRSYTTYRALTWASAFLPPRGASGRGTFVHLATRDSGFGGTSPYKTEKTASGVKRYFKDEDYGEVVTLNGRPVDTGTRFASMRKALPLVPLFEVPTAKKALLAGPEAEFYAGTLKSAGIEVEVSPAAEECRGTADFALVCMEPEWVAGAERVDADGWRRLAGLVDREYGVVAVHIDSRLLSASRAKGLFGELREVFPSARLWCVGKFDWVFVGFSSAEPPIVRASAVMKLFERDDAFNTFLEAGVTWVGDFLANYTGSLEEILPALDGVEAAGRQAAQADAPRLAFEPPPTGGLAQLKPGDLLRGNIDMGWFVRGSCDEDVYSSLTGRVADVQWARRVAVAGLAAADAGKSEEAVDKWGEAASVNTYDPMLKSLADSLDLEGRRRLRVGDNNGAMRCFENRILVEPDNVAAIHNFGLSVKNGGRAELAAQVFMKAVLMDPLNDAHRLELVECASAAGKNDVALNQLDVLIKRHPDDVSLKRRRAKILVHGLVNGGETQNGEKEERK